MQYPPRPSDTPQEGNISVRHSQKALTPTLSQRARGICGFTLVELIVVITILAILGTISFIQLQGFAGSARDSVRIENLGALQKGLSLFNVTSGVYPIPENAVTITASGTPIGYQGFAGDTVGGIVRLSKGATQDPLDPSIFTTYSVNESRTKMQLMSFLEDGGSVTAYKEIPPTPPG